AAGEIAAGRSARAACTRRAASPQRSRRAHGLCRWRGALDQRTSAYGRRCQREPAAPCTAGGGVGKGRPHGRRYRRLQSRAKALCLLGVFAARGSDTLTRRSFPRHPRFRRQGIRSGQEDEIFEEEKDEEGSFCRNEEARQKGCRQEDKEGAQEG